jgi:hypothetical protein
LLSIYVGQGCVFANTKSFFQVYSLTVCFRFDGSDDRRKSGFAGRKDSDEEEEEEKPATRVGGVAIAPPPSLQEPTSPGESSRPPAAPLSGDKYGLAFGGSVAAKIMAKYGFKVRGTELCYLYKYTFKNCNAGICCQP